MQAGWKGLCAVKGASGLTLCGHIVLDVRFDGLARVVWNVSRFCEHVCIIEVGLWGAQWLDKLEEGMDKIVRRAVHEPADLLHLFRCCVLRPPACTVYTGPRDRGCHSGFGMHIAG